MKLMTYVHLAPQTRIKVDNLVIKERAPLLHVYFHHQSERELQALYALQALVHSLQHPQGEAFDYDSSHGFEPCLCSRIYV